jgi:hypothetical protein
VKEAAVMKIKVKSEKIIKAVKKLDGVELVLENADDVKEALDLVLRKSDLLDSKHHEQLQDLKVTSFEKYETSAVDYKMIVLIEFIFAENSSLNDRIHIIKAIQEFFEKV